MDDCEHPLLYLPVTGRDSQETAISGSCGAVSGWPFLLSLLYTLSPYFLL
ncbi:hypothetical protein T4D_8426 [Trichinella pseudospiralis]|uniref:Uncharacterized protein n=1 Tax=Trichinella pseudospiralis TaxID=6337 RepID=A0A0V1DKK6_TRIPS|nr:hypothetical protein T4D_8426 [Trichinella pseudospiralis]